MPGFPETGTCDILNILTVFSLSRNDEGRQRMGKPEELHQRRGEGGCKGAMRHWPLINFCSVGESFNLKDDLIETRAREDEVSNVKYHI